MCVTCGCSEGAEITITHDHTLEIGTPEHTHLLADGTVITHIHSHTHDHPDSSHDSHPLRPMNQTNGAISLSPPDPSHLHAAVHGTTITLEQKILAKNDLLAAQNRGWFKGRNILALNLLSSPGSGKTTLLTRTIQDLQDQIPISVIEGDQATANDAQRIRQTGCNVVQINTGTGCHLDAAMVEQGLQQLQPPLDSVVMIENVGNLVCPALFDLGETAKVVVLSVTEGEDKPIKYPHMFRASQVMLLNKIDLLPYVVFDVDRCLEYAHQVNPQLQIFQISASTGAGLADWYTWIRAAISA